MTKKDIAVVFDCGATNVRVIAMDTKGKIIASKSMPNQTDEDPHLAGGRIWDLEILWQKLCKAAISVTSSIDTQRIAGVTVTTFGVDGAFTDKEGNLLYPIISWQCDRTQAIMNSIDKYIPLEDLYKISGVYPYAFNTINKFIWFKENRPDIITNAHRFLFITSLLINKLSGVLQNDTTMMGTSMMSDLKERSFSEEILQKIGIDASIFGTVGEPGDQAGNITSGATEATGIPTGTPVFLAGHDTQFAIYGSGAELKQPVLSSGTWEILMARSDAFTSSTKELENDLTTEIDAETNTYNIGQNWLGSGILEWFSRNFYPELSGDKLYETMIEEGEQFKPGQHGLHIDPNFYTDKNKKGGTIKGLTISTSRSEIYRALLESLAFRLRESLEALQNAGNFKAERIICVGGGSKNRLWNQLRADVCQIPIQLIEHKETTVLGAALFVFAGSRLFENTDEARKQIEYHPQLIQPSNNSLQYNELYNNYLNLNKENNQ
jgi:L-fuculokinase